MEMKRNFFVAIYGIASVGKTTQRGMLKLEFEKQDHSVMAVSYGVGSLQSCAGELEDLISEHDVVIAEIQTEIPLVFGKGICVDKDQLREVRSVLKRADFSILLDGGRFPRHVNGKDWYKLNNKNTENIRKAHREAAQEFGWSIINADRSKGAVHADIWYEVFMKILHLDRV